MRSESNESIQRTIANVEGAENAQIFNSFDDALICALLPLLREGDHILSSSSISDSARRIFTTEIIELDVETTFVRPTEPRSWRTEIRDNTRVIFLQNPLDADDPTVLDMRPVTLLAESYGVVLMVDATHATPKSFLPLEHGVDVLVNSLSRYNGNGNNEGTLGELTYGVVVGTTAYMKEVRRKMSVIA